MSDLRKAAQMALEAYDQHDPLGVVMADLRAALAQPERKPLTDEQLMSVLPGAVRLPPGWRDFARAIEKAHGIGDTNEQ